MPRQAGRQRYPLVRVKPDTFRKLEARKRRTGETLTQIASQAIEEYLAAPPLGAILAEMGVDKELICEALRRQWEMRGGNFPGGWNVRED